MKLVPKKNQRTKGPGRVTIEDIGERLNVSTSTVSRALRQDALIHPETRARVNAAAMDLGYQGRARQSRNRSTKKQNSLAVLFSATSLAQARTSYITSCYLQGLTAEAESDGIALSLHTVVVNGTPSGSEAAGIPQGLRAEERDAVIVLGHHRDASIRRLAQEMPVISLVRSYADITHDLVSTPDVEGMGLVVGELVRQGHRRLAWSGGTFPGSMQDSRRAGFVQGCLGQGLSLEALTIFEPDAVFSDTALIAPEKLLEAHRRGVTAFVCSNDHAASLAANAFRQAGARVPEDVSVTGFDCSLEMSGNDYPLTTVDPQFVEMGRTAVRLARWRLEQPAASPINMHLKARLVVGASTGPALRSLA